MTKSNLSYMDAAEVYYIYSINDTKIICLPVPLHYLTYPLVLSKRLGLPSPIVLSLCRFKASGKYLSVVEIEFRSSIYHSYLSAALSFIGDSESLGPVGKERLCT